MRKFKRVLITGIAGSGGSYLAEQILDQQKDIQLSGTTRWHSTTNKSNLINIIDQVKLYECDLNDFSSTLRTLQDFKPDLIFNLASIANVRACFDTPLTIVQNNIMSTLNLLEAIRFCKTKPLLVHCSTSEVYGQVDESNVPITEDCPINPVNPYSVSKCSQDQLVYTYGKAYNLPTIRTRMFSYLNPRRFDLFATSFARQVILIEQGKQTILKHGNLESLRTLIDVRDATRSYWEVAKYGKLGEVYNLGGTTSLSVGDFLALLICKSKVAIKTQPDQSLFRPIDITLQIPDTTKFNSITKWRPQYSLEQSVDFLLDQLRSLI